MVTGLGVTETDAMRFDTVKVQRSVALPLEAVIVAEPSPAATASPLLLTRITAELDVDQLTCFVSLDDSWTESPTKIAVVLPAGGLGMISRVGSPSGRMESEGSTTEGDLSL